MEYKAICDNKGERRRHMMPVGYLMIEHRLIERMVRLMTAELERINKGNKPNLDFLDVAVDFIRGYADKCHHGKEEDILFRDLSSKNLTSNHRNVMEELIEEHKQGREAVAKLIKAKTDFVELASRNALEDIKKQIKFLVDFYPRHIAKEDKNFFIPSMSYFNKEEQSNMLKEFCKFDGASIQDTYRSIVQSLGDKKV